MRPWSVAKCTAPFRALFAKIAATPPALRYMALADSRKCEITNASDRGRRSFGLSSRVRDPAAHGGRAG